ncbi:serine hydrolase family protein [Patescibacteria group bacterium]|nr:MAG: serine hydrolase family protein [Patescibacteria group bacterium]
MSRVIVVHGWGDSPEINWMPWLKAELEKRSFSVLVPEMPDTEHPNIDKWVGKLREVVGVSSADTILVGHSIGCQTIMRYLATSDMKVGRVVFVAPWFTLIGLEDEEVLVARPWLNTPIDFEAVKRSAAEIVAIFSDDDPVVPIENERMFHESLGARTIVVHGKGHFDDAEAPEVLAEIVR